MSILVKVHTNGDDALVAWRPRQWRASWVGFRLQRRNAKTGEVTTINNRIPPRAGAGEVPGGGLSSELSPIRRCMWTDHGVNDADRVSYRVTPMSDKPDGSFRLVESAASAWTAPVVVGRVFGDGLSACFNRGTLMSQVVSRMVGGDVGVASLKRFKQQLEQPGFAARRYLSGDARHALLQFLAQADQRGSAVFAALYEINDRELIEALKPFGARAHLLLGNGSSTDPGVADELTSAGLEVRRRDLSHSGLSSPSVHNKFVVEVSAAGAQATRVLTGSTNWTTTGLCTQLNNVMVIERPATAARFLAQWQALVAAGDNMPAGLVRSNMQPCNDGPVTTVFAATRGQSEFQPVLELIRRRGGDGGGLLFLMFTPGQSPLLEALLDRASEIGGPYVRGVVSKVKPSADGSITRHDAQVVKTGVDPKLFRESVLLPDGVPAGRVPSWAREEFQQRLYFAAGLNAIVHSKVIVVDPFADDCAVITGSHNFSPSASTRNDENLVIVRGNRALAQAYALHIEGIHDHFAWRAFLAGGGDPDQIFKPLDGWRPGGSRERELNFWLR